MRRTILIVLLCLSPILLFLLGVMVLLPVRISRVERIAKPRIEITQRLTPEKINGQNLDYGERTLLHRAAEGGEMARVEEMLRLGGDPNIQDNEGRTALHLAASHGHSGAVETLLRFGAKPWITDQTGLTAKDVALQGGHAQTAQTIAVMELPAEARPRVAAQPEYAFAPATNWAMVMFGGLKLLMLLGLLVLPLMLIVLTLLRRRNGQRNRLGRPSVDQASRLQELACLAERMEARIVNLETILMAQETHGGSAGKLG